MPDAASQLEGVLHDPHLFYYEKDVGREIKKMWVVKHARLK